jgi:hypothetical protein
MTLRRSLRVFLCIGGLGLHRALTPLRFAWIADPHVVQHLGAQSDLWSLEILPRSTAEGDSGRHDDKGERLQGAILARNVPVRHQHGQLDRSADGRILRNPFWRSERAPSQKHGRDREREDVSRRLTDPNGAATLL